MLAFVTVGSTKFDDLVQVAISEDTLSALRRKGYTKLVVQCGNSSHEFSALVQDDRVCQTERGGIDIEIWKFKPSLQRDYEEADLVVSHGGVNYVFPPTCLPIMEARRIWDDS